MQRTLMCCVANHSKEDEIYPLTVKEIVTAQKADRTLQQNKDKYKKMLVENTNILLCKDGKLFIPKSLQHRAVSWYHHYLQYLGNTSLEGTVSDVMYWTIRQTVQSYVKNC